MKPSELMTWAGPLPPSFEDPSGETSEASETMTFAGPLLADGTEAVAQNEPASETMMWTGPLAPEEWKPASRKTRKVPTVEFARAKRAEAKT